MNTPEDIELLESENPQKSFVKSTSLKKTWMSAQRLLARREHSRKELKEKLQAREFELAEIETVLDELQQKGWQDDSKFCEAFIRYRVNKGQGPQKIIHELKSRGVDSHIISQQLQIYDAQWIQLCENVQHKKYGSVRTKTAEERARRYRFLSTRGFTAETVRQILK
jgi:regulatory protein